MSGGAAPPPASRCPHCAEPGAVPVGAAVACAACGGRYWAVAGRDTGEPFTLGRGAGGFLLACWSVVAAAGVLAAFAALLGLELWGLVAVVRWLAAR